MNEKTHSSLLALAGAYVLYLAYELIRDYVNGVGNMPAFLRILFAVLLALGGLGALWYAWVYYKKGKKAEKQQEQEKEDGNQLK